MMMDVPVGSSHRSGRDTTTSSPDRAKICRLKQKQQKVPVTSSSSVRKVQVVYYLSRNGLLEHPHFMEITLSSANQPLRLKDVFDRLMALRGSGMPSQYSWSSKRNYKSGYVWCDLALMDIILASEGGEYVLKGSELVEAAGCSSERFERLNVSNIKEGNRCSIQQNYRSGFNNNNNNNNSIKCGRSKEAAVLVNSGRGQEKLEVEDEEEYEEEEEEYMEEEIEKLDDQYTSSTTTPHSRCSRGVSTEEVLLDDDQELQRQYNHQNNKTKVNNNNSRTPPPTSTTTTSLAEKLSERERVKLNSNYPKRTFGNGNGNGNVRETSSAAPSRYSVLLQLIACGSSGAEFKAAKQQQDAGGERSRLSNVGTTTTKRSTEISLDHKKKSPPYSNDDDDDDEIEIDDDQMEEEENPRMRRRRMLGKKINMVQQQQYYSSCEEKEYFSGSIVDSMKAKVAAIQEQDQETGVVLLKRSNSYNEQLQRRSRIGMIEEEVKRKQILEPQKFRDTKPGGGGGGTLKDKCIPLKKSSNKDRHY